MAYMGPRTSMRTESFASPEGLGEAPALWNQVGSGGAGKSREGRTRTYVRFSVSRG